jgi:NitT/TauT family transport system substrate-binding protein
MMPLKLRAFGSVLLVALFLGACSSAAPQGASSGPPVSSAAAAGTSAVAGAQPSGSAAAARSRMVAGFAVISATQLPLWGAAQGGFFTNHGLDVQVIQAGAGSTGLSALLSGEISVLGTSAGSTMNAVAEGHPLVWLGSTMDKLQQYMMVKKDRNDISRPEDMRGKKVGVTTPGSISDSAAHYVAYQAGLKEGQDYTIVRMNDLPVITAAAQNGAIDVAFGSSGVLGLAETGLKVVLDLTKLPGAYSSTGYATSRAYYEQHPQEIKAFVAALSEAVKRAKSDPDFAAQVLGERLKVTDRKTLDGVAAEFLPDMNLEIGVNREGLETARKTSALSIPKLEQFEVAKMLP